ncbi:MAG TPA: hypothetical protein VFC21_06435 [Bryobacteraceae bacterium]|nr:hypothetical protein [Bryobacteraceae bacterium]
MPRAVAHAPEELTRDRLARLGEGIGKVVYASEHWVVRRERTAREIVALIIVWKFLRHRAHRLPFGWGRVLLNQPTRIVRFSRVVIETIIAVLPRSLWYTKHVSQVLTTYRSRDRRGERLARLHLDDTDLVPETITFPPTLVPVAGKISRLRVDQATERVEDTLDRRLNDLAEARDFKSVEDWLNRFLETRQTGWQLGLFSVDAHLKNFGIIGERVVLLDSGGLTDRWIDISAKLSIDEQAGEPHVQLGLDQVLASEPELARRFNNRWRSLVNRDSVIEHWPGDPRP